MQKLINITQMYQNNCTFFHIISINKHYLYIFIIPTSFASKIKKVKFHFIKIKNQSIILISTS